MPKSLLKRSNDLASFETLVRKVKNTLLLGQRQVRMQMAKTYWQIGRLIHEHILRHKDRAGYGEQVISQIAKRVDLSERSIHRVLKLYRQFPKIPTTLSELELSHLYALATISDKKTRYDFARRAAEGRWTTDKLESRIKLELASDLKNSSKVNRDETQTNYSELIRPKLGMLYTYRLVGSATSESGLKIDQGFSVYRTEFDLATKFKSGEIVESERNEGGVYTARKSKRDESDLFTYQAIVIRVVDGDTLVVEIDLGFTNTTKQYLRLRGIDCPEIDTPAGKKAKEFVISALRSAPFIFLTSTRSDKYDRYLADVFIPGKTFLRDWSQDKAVLKESEDLLYLNNELLRRKLAVRMWS